MIDYLEKWHKNKIDEIFWQRITEYNKKNERYTHTIIISPYVLLIEWDQRWNKKVYLADECIDIKVGV